LLTDELDGEACTRDGCVLVRADVPKVRARYLAACELSWWWYTERRNRRPSIVQTRQLAAAILAPRGEFLVAVDALGPTPIGLASLFIVPQALALLRIGETTGRPVALLDARGHIATVRGDARLWKAGKRTRVHLTDDDRVGLLQTG
jgi:hypothetical protein